MGALIAKKNSTAGAQPTPAQMAVGELAVNTADALLFTKHSDNTVKKILSPQDFWGVLYGALGDCDPAAAINRLDLASVAGPTPAGITTTIARAVKFRPPALMTLGKVHLFGIAAVTGGYKFAIYDAVTLARIWESGAVNSPANAWLTIAVSPTVTLKAGNDYLFCVTGIGTGAVAGFRSPSPPFNSALFGAAASPLGNTSVGLAVFTQFAITASTFPATLPALAAAAYAGGATGSVPLAFLAP
jgi:hypothetical protein